jgi:bifunctional DNA-binding transcriptional regulator/antitoxin component of YhaV-PrlF toxin-antitoxin module
MTTILKEKTRLIVPRAIQRRAGLKAGDRVEFRVSRGVITIVPGLPATGDEYTPEQRRQLDAQLAEGLEDIRKGRVSPKFDTAEEMLASLKVKAARQRKTHAKNR